MCSAIVLDGDFFSFVPSGSDVEGGGSCPAPEAPVDTAALEQQIRASLEEEYRHNLEQELAVRMGLERSRFEQLLQECSMRFDGLVESLRHEIQAQVVDLSLQLAEVVVRHELPDRDMLRELIVKTLEPISDLQGARVRVSSADWQLFDGTLLDGEERGLCDTVEFVEDPQLSSGDVLVESRNGIFDARLKERLKLLKETLHERSGRNA